MALSRQPFIYKPVNSSAEPALHHLSSQQRTISASSAVMKTRFLILSDTHATAYTAPKTYADVALHGGDLTESSTLDEYRSAVKLLKEVNAPLKLAIAGNHDFTLDIPLYKSRMDQAPPERRERLIEEYGDFGEARHLFEEAGIIILDEGTHHFSLENGASLSIYASPYTPSFGSWGFQYTREQGHEFNIKGVDIAMTHGPPRGILDETIFHDEAGCTTLLRAISQARPKVHCFGHIHEAWGAKLITWQNTGFSAPVDKENSVLVNSLTGAKESEELMNKLKARQLEGYYATSHCTDDPTPIQPGQQTLVINASIKGHGWNNYQLPWLVDIELPRTD
ncbi:hypothetical protein McanMca71_007434 [Microsporum canis]|uniref:Metallophosphoesterase domain-containing protein 2 n=1 Tax=Arthroderma otae (strain ATCC MYA-4605 / CBS 113480) TaxID=554155 RepID=C5FRA8_ARTOC|nr:metallophosphoesterase domain-containing protein 2 [Microsporum canis CBS 113480]EEQ32411.1 metallophosphoesterase domain-containing protein 2 [Microsporum canis CBS 113480]